MLKKGLLITTESGKDYTHIVTVAKNGNIVGYFRNDTGDIVPKTIDYFGEVGTIEYVNSMFGQFTQFTVRFNNNSGISSMTPNVHIGRSDRKEYLGITTTDYMPKVIFTDEDIGKDIPIWLSTTPPPIQIKKSRWYLPALERRAW